VEEIYLEIAPADIAFLKFVVESYEGLGIVRTVDRAKAIVVVLATRELAAETRRVVQALARELEAREIGRPPDLPDDWLMRELATEDEGD
jgi:hypothetical protein